MQFLTLSKSEIQNPSIYGQVKVPHIVISISGDEDQETLVPPNQFRRAILHLKFDDVSDIDGRYLFFTREQATEILEFVNKHVMNVQLIVVQCQAGLSRSVGTAAALSKIINYVDDGVFTKGIPNMFIYTTILDTLFGDPDWYVKYSKINTMRTKSMGNYLTPAQVRLSLAKEKRREN